MSKKGGAGGGNTGGSDQELTPEKLQQLQQLQMMFAAMAQQQQGQQKQQDNQQQEPKKKFNIADLKNITWDDVRNFNYKQQLIKLANYLFKQMGHVVVHIDRFMNFVVHRDSPDRNDVVQYARPPILFGVYVVSIFVIFGGLWASFAPLDSAAVAVGTVIPSTNKKIIQHQEGGIVKEIRVKQGDQVREGDVLVVLDETKFRTSYEVALNNYRTNAALEARLIAERDGAEQVEFPEFLIADQSVPVVGKLMEVQSNLFVARKNYAREKLEANLKTIEQHRQRIHGLEVEKQALEERLSYLSERVQAYTELSAKGYSHRAALLEQKGTQAQYKAEIAKSGAQISQLEEEISKVEVTIASDKNELLSRVLAELKETQQNLTKSKEEYTYAKDAIDRSIIRSPVDGHVIDIKAHTVGGIIRQTEEIAQIAPDKDLLIIEAKVEPKDIASIVVGLKAKIKFSAFKSRTSPSFSGVVTSLSPDLVVDYAPNGAKMPAYIAKIQIDMEEFNALGKRFNLTLVPGMQAEVQIIRGTRTLMRYLLDPVADQMFRAFTEK